MWQTKYALAVPINLGLGLNFFGRAVQAISSLGVRSPCLHVCRQKNFYTYLRDVG